MFGNIFSQEYVGSLASRLKYLRSFSHFDIKVMSELLPQSLQVDAGMVEILKKGRQFAVLRGGRSKGDRWGTFDRWHVEYKAGDQLELIA